MIDLVLIGGGHSHVAVLKQFGMRPFPGVRLTLISRGVDTPYSGMLPGLIAGHYTYDDAHIDLQRLARFAGARTCFDEAVGLDLAERRVHCRARPPVRFDLLSINIGSTPNASVPGADLHATPVKPIDRFLERWRTMQDRVRADRGPRRLAVVGGGAGGVELILSVEHSLRLMLAGDGQDPDRVRYTLYAAGETILPTHNYRARARFDRILRDRRIAVQTGARIARVEPGRLVAEGGQAFDADEILWTTEARAAAWIAESGLATDGSGFIRVSPALQSLSHDCVFAAGDVASIDGYTLEKSGVYAVREGQALAPNLRRAARGKPLRPYRPQRQFLSLISTGDRYAVGSRGPFVLEGGWVWRWKDRIDRRFMEQYQRLPLMDAAHATSAPTRDATSDAAMRCGGCGAKVGATVLARVLSRLHIDGAPDVSVGLTAPDDAAIVDVAAPTALVHTVDFFRAMLDDPFTFGRIAANHALGDVYAMGAEPRTALAIVTVPHGSDAEVEETLAHLMGGAARVLRDAGVTLVGGHTSEGAELALGFAVNGIVDPSRVLRKGGMRPGDALILTKPIGTGTLFAADMRHEAKGAWIEQAIAAMTQPARDAAAILQRHGATACTDVTGFGLAGHLAEMITASGVDVTLQLEAVPLLPGAIETIAAGFTSTLQPQNLAVLGMMVGGEPCRRSPRFALLFDPQTAGGLLASVPGGQASRCATELAGAGYQAAIIGRVGSSSTSPSIRCE